MFDTYFGTERKMATIKMAAKKFENLISVALTFIIRRAKLF